MTNMEQKQPSALEVQVGGSHYKDCAIQPVQFIEANSLGFLEGCVVKRITRHNKPTGKGRQDIEKAIHELQLLLEHRYPQAPAQPLRRATDWPQVANDNEACCNGGLRNHIRCKGCQEGQGACRD